jgi:hypothetical protein
MEKKERPKLALKIEASSDQECVNPRAVPAGIADTQPVNAEHPLYGSDDHIFGSVLKDLKK